MANVNVDPDSLVRHSVALILMNVRKNHVIRVHVAKIRLVHSDVLVLLKQSEIRIAILDVYSRINVAVTLIALIIWLVYKENVQIRALLHSAEEVPNVNQLTIKHCVIVHQVIWGEL